MSKACSRLTRSTTNSDSTSVISSSRSRSLLATTLSSSLSKRNNRSRTPRPLIWNDDRRLVVFSSPLSWKMRSYDSMKNFGLNLRPMPPMKRDRRMRLVMVGNSTASESLHSSCNLAAYLSSHACLDISSTPNFLPVMIPYSFHRRVAIRLARRRKKKQKSPCLDPFCPWKSQGRNFEKTKRECEKDQGALVEVFRCSRLFDF